jgi:CubicO group peptidase (beta-lactamase class C family)
MIAVVALAAGVAGTVAVRPGGAVAGQETSAARAFEGFRTFYRQAVARAGVVGSSVRVVHDGRVVFSDSVGMAKLDERQPVDSGTIFHWASITKTFTAVAIMQLRDRGRLGLDDPIVKYVPELREVRNPFGSMDAITIRQLLSHSAGFRSATWPWGGDKPWEPFEPPGWLQLRAMFPYTEILFPPGSKFSYSNPGLVFAGRVIELLTNEDYEVYVDKNILNPLEMRSAFFDRTPYFLLPHRSASYWLRGGRPEPARFDFDTGVTVSNGGLNAPLDDMVRYLDFLMGTAPDAATRARYDQVLVRSSLEEMWKPVVPVDGPDAGGAESAAMGLCFFLERHRGLDFIAHSGGQNAFISHFYVHQPSRTAYLVAFNTIGDPPEKDGRGDTRGLDRAIRDHLMANVFPVWAAH